MPKKLTQEEAELKVKEICKQKNYKYEPFLYINSKITKIILTCGNGHTWNSTNFYNLIKGTGCPKCSSGTLSQLEAQNIVSKICKDKNYSCEEFVFTGVDTTKLSLKCHCGYSWNSTTYYWFIRGHGCKNCSGKKRRTQKEAEAEVKIRCEEYNYTYHEFVYKNNQTKIPISCNCGYNWNISFSKLVLSNRRCPKCVGKNPKIAYITLIHDNKIPIALKYGIESVLGNRIQKQKNSLIYNLSRIKNFIFKHAENCKSAENECKTFFQNENKNLYGRKGILNKREMYDGWTETTEIKNIDKIIEIYKKWGGIEISNELESIAA